jgi:hypothetical protein
MAMIAIAVAIVMRATQRVAPTANHDSDRSRDNASTAVRNSSNSASLL